MKRHVLVLTSIFVLSMFGISVVLASIALPPSDPTQAPPGLFLSAEQARKMEIANEAAKHCKENFELETRTPSTHQSWLDALERYHECMKGVHFFLEGPPSLILPNGGTPGQGK